MKKLAILACGVLAACALMLTACGDEPNVETPTTVPTTIGHTHAFGEWVTVKEATCTEKGEQERVCACGEKITQSVNMVAHTFNEWYTTKEATCTETGKQECNCACGKKKTRNVPMIAHTEVIDEAVAHSCTETGLTEGKHCSVCNMVLQKQEIVAASHTWSIEYQSDQDVHWTYCDKCGTVSEQMLHTINRADYCSVCKMQNAKGLICVIPEKCMYARVVGYTGSATCVKIPEEYQGLPVTQIADSAFSEKRITDVIIPDSVTTIDHKAFIDCRNLTSVTIGNGVTRIGDYAFYKCYNITNLIIGSRVTIIGFSAFDGCTNLTSVTIPDSVTTIRGSAFLGCMKLTSVTIPDSVTDIGGDAFGKCYSLASVTISNNITKIPPRMFASCNSLTSVTIPDSVNTIGEGAFRTCSALTSVIIPDNVTVIDAEAFAYCYNLTSITIPDSVKIVGIDAFTDCNKLQYTEYNNCKYLGNAGNPYLVLITTVNNDSSSYTIHKDAKVIAGAAFLGCSELMSIVIPDEVITIGTKAFYGCAKLANLTIGSKVKTIRGAAFKDCTGLTTVTIPDSVTTIGLHVFEQCSSLRTVTIGKGVHYLNYGVFEACGNLIEIYFHGTMQQWKNINKEFSWDIATGEYIVHCLDGDLEKDTQ